MQGTTRGVPTCANRIHQRHRPVPQRKLAALRIPLRLLLLVCMQHCWPQLHHHLTHNSSTSWLLPHRHVLPHNRVQQHQRCMPRCKRRPQLHYRCKHGSQRRRKLAPAAASWCLNQIRGSPRNEARGSTAGCRHSCKHSSVSCPQAAAEL
jgi:hypothetical protein